MKLSHVKTMCVTEDDNDGFADLARVEAFEQLPADLQESIVAGELHTLDELLRANYPLAAFCALQQER